MISWHPLGDVENCNSRSFTIIANIKNKDVKPDLKVG
jgi:hypothetical protein